MKKALPAASRPNLRSPRLPSGHPVRRLPQLNFVAPSIAGGRYWKAFQTASAVSVPLSSASNSTGPAIMATWRSILQTPTARSTLSIVSSAESPTGRPRRLSERRYSASRQSSAVQQGHPSPPPGPARSGPPSEKRRCVFASPAKGRRCAKSRTRVDETAVIPPVPPSSGPGLKLSSARSH